MEIGYGQADAVAPDRGGHGARSTLLRIRNDLQGYSAHARGGAHATAEPCGGVHLTWRASHSGALSPGTMEPR